jgi:hypothetical protein
MKAKKTHLKHQHLEAKAKHQTTMAPSIDVDEEPEEPASLEAAEDQLVTREPMTSRL